MIIVDITADLNAEDDTGYIWTFLDEARDPSLIVPGVVVIAGRDQGRDHGGDSSPSTLTCGGFRCRGGVGWCATVDYLKALNVVVIIGQAPGLQRSNGAGICTPLRNVQMMLFDIYLCWSEQFSVLPSSGS